MTTTTKTTTKATTKATSAKVSTKAKGNTPISAKATTPAVTKTTTKKQSVFALVAGAVCKIEHKGLNKAIAYHVSKGNLSKTEQGIKLTAQGATAWTKERILIDPAKFQEVAAFISGGDILKEFKGQPLTTVAQGKNFPNSLYWGSFSTSLMRQCFAALWAK